MADGTHWPIVRWFRLWVSFSLSFFLFFSFFLSPSLSVFIYLCACLLVDLSFYLLLSQHLLGRADWLAWSLRPLLLILLLRSCIYSARRIGTTRVRGSSFFFHTFPYAVGLWIHCVRILVTFLLDWQSISIFLSVCLSVYLSINISIVLSIYIYLSISICLSICLPI